MTAYCIEHYWRSNRVGVCPVDSVIGESSLQTWFITCSYMEVR